MKIAANLTMLFPEVPMLDKPAHAARLGFDGVECLLPYDLGPKPFSSALAKGDMPLALINTPEPGWSDGHRGRAAIPGEVQRFREEFVIALEFARTAGAERIHVMAGLTQDAAAFDTFTKNLRWATEQAGDLPLCIEPLNPTDMPGYYLNDYPLARKVIEAVGAPTLGLQYDSWHAARIHADALQVWQDHADIAIHVQIAGFAQRGAPNPQDPEEAALLRAIAASTYTGWISAEYICQPGEDAKWLAPMRRIQQTG